jgi:hypothetical protein
MKKMILSLAVAGSMIIATSACNSTRNMSDNTDSTTMDSTAMPVDTNGTVDTTTMPPDTTAMPDTSRTQP